MEGRENPAQHHEHQHSCQDDYGEGGGVVVWTAVFQVARSLRFNFLHQMRESTSAAFFWQEGTEIAFARRRRKRAAETNIVDLDSALRLAESLTEEAVVAQPKARFPFRG